MLKVVDNVLLWFIERVLNLVFGPPYDYDGGLWDIDEEDLP